MPIQNNADAKALSMKRKDQLTYVSEFIGGQVAPIYSKLP